MNINARARSGSFIPELHDISPHVGDRLDRMMALLPDAARGLACLLVVPNWSGEWPLERFPAFTERLRALGNDRVLHGYTHSLGPNRWNRFMWGTDNHAEFGRASRAEAARRLALGQRTFEAAFGTRAHWFCAPRWQQSPAATAALNAEGLCGRMTTRGFDHADGEHDAVPAVWFDNGRRWWRASLSAVSRRARIARVLREGRRFRLVLHPNDVEDSGVVSEIRDLTRRLRQDGWTPEALPPARGPAQ